MSREGDRRELLSNLLVLVPTRLEFHPFRRAFLPGELLRVAGSEQLEFFCKHFSLTLLELGIGELGIPSLQRYLSRNRRVDRVLLVGTAGAVVEDIHVRELLQAKRIRRFDSEEVIVPALLDWPDVKTVDFVTVEKPLLSLRGKQRLHEQTGSHCVDMEAFHVAELCSELDLPFFMFRGVSDELRPFGLLHFLWNYRTVTQSLALRLNPSKTKA